MMPAETRDDCQMCYGFWFLQLCTHCLHWLCPDCLKHHNCDSLTDMSRRLRLPANNPDGGSE